MAKQPAAKRARTAEPSEAGSSELLETLLASAGGASGSGASGSTQRTLSGFVINGQIQDKFRDTACRLLYENCTSLPLSVIEAPRFRELFTLLGMTPPSRKQVAGKKLDEVYEEAVVEMDARMQAGNGQFAIGSDGWSRKVTGNGGKLINIVVLFPDGGAMFRKVIQVNDASCTAEFLARTLRDAALEIVGGDMAALQERLLGFVLDATSANVAAERILQREFPFAIPLVCQSHGLANLLKDFSKVLPVVGSSAAAGKKVATLFNEKQDAKRLMKEAQVELYKRIKLLRLPPETRFGYIVEMMHDLLASEQALKLAAMGVEFDAAFPNAEGSDRGAWEVKDLVTGSRFWRELKSTVAMMDPVKKCIHTVEADRLVIGCTFCLLTRHWSRYPALGGSTPLDMLQLLL